MADQPPTTTNSGIPVPSDEHSLTVGPGGPGTADQVYVSVYPTWNDQQAAGVQLLRPRHLAAKLGYPAIPHAYIGDLMMIGSDDGPASDDEFEVRSSHTGILARKRAPRRRKRSVRFRPSE